MAHLVVHKEFLNRENIAKALAACPFAALEEKGLITTEATMIRRKDGRPMNGSLLYTIRPIQNAVEICAL